MKIDCESRRVFIGEKEINLTAKEFDLLELLAMNPNKVYSRENLLNIVWGYEYPGDARTVDVHIRRLREKIETNPSDPKYVYTKWGVGYYFRGLGKYFKHGIFKSPLDYPSGYAGRDYSWIIMKAVILNSYEKRAVDVRTAEIQNQCTILCNQLSNSSYLDGITSEVIKKHLVQLSNIQWTSHGHRK